MSSPAKRKHDTASTPLSRLLDDTTVQSFCQRRQFVCTLEHSTTVAEALAELGKHNVLSAPVVLAASIEDQESDTFLGIVDMNTMLHALVTAVQEKTAHTSPEDSDGKFLQQLRDTWSEVSQRKLITLTGEGADVSLQFRTALHATLRDLLTHAFVPAHRPPVHRVAVFDTRGRISQIVSQTDVVRHLDAHVKELGMLGHKTLRELHFLHEVVSVPAKYTAASAFHTMHAKHVSGVAVVDEHGRVVKNLSASDIRAVQGGHTLGRLLEPVGEFAPDRPLVTLRPDDVFMHAIHVLAADRLHHVFIVDEHMHPIGTVSLTDVLRAVAKAAAAENDEKTEETSVEKAAATATLQ